MKPNKHFDCAQFSNCEDLGLVQNHRLRGARAQVLKDEVSRLQLGYANQMRLKPRDYYRLNFRRLPQNGKLDCRTQFARIKICAFACHPSSQIHIALLDLCIHPKTCVALSCVGFLEVTRQPQLQSSSHPTVHTFAPDPTTSLIPI